MKSLILALSLLSSALASADQACSALGNVKGHYRLQSYTCTGLSGDRLSVEHIVEHRPHTYGNYLITSGPMAVGISTEPSSLDLCGEVDGVVTVKTCVRSNCTPQNWTYTFSRDRVQLNANGCIAEFTKIVSTSASY